MARRTRYSSGTVAARQEKKDAEFWASFKDKEKEAFLAPHAKGRQTIINAYGKNLPSNYKKTEQQAFKEAKEHNIKTKGRTDLDMDLDKLYKQETSLPQSLPEVVKKSPPQVAPQPTFEDLRYPYSTIDGTQDFIKFTALEYVRKGLTQGPDKSARILGNVILPIPAQLTDTNSVDYGQGSLNFIQEAGMEGATALIGGNVDRAKRAVTSLAGQAGANADMVNNWFAMQAVNALGIGGQLDFNQLLARQTGGVINPNMELLFKGPTLRDFSFLFKFTPRFQKEAQAVRSIIRTFKKNMAPRRGVTAATLKTPNIFQIKYIGKAADYLNKMKLCALKNVATNYTADGTFATYTDGSPISLTMTLSFTEIMPVYNEDYDSSVGGVGY